MSDHLPECPWADRGYAFPCICDRLRACEQRVFQEQIEGRQHDMVMAYLRGLDAAREAVDRLASDMANWNSAETADATTAFADLSADQWIWAQRGVHRALAAIDALRGES